MANHQGAVPTWLNAEYLQTVFRTVLQKNDLEVTSVDISAGSKPGDNYACQIFRIKLTFSGEEDLSVIGKYEPSTKLLDTFKEDWSIFETESSFLQETLAKFQQVSKEDVNFAPKCYFVDKEKKIILMEDLTTKGYELQPRKTFLSQEQCELTLEALAVLHGTSYYALQEDPNLKNKYKKGFWSSEKNEPIEKWFANADKVLKQVIGTYGLSEEFTAKILRFMDEISVDWLKVCDLQEGKLNFLCHGDCWMNNMMFHYKNGVPDQVKLLDYQIANYNCFANDLQYFLFSSVSSDVVVNNLDHLLNVYYQKLLKVAPDIPNLTFERVKKEFEERFYFGYTMTIVFRSVTVADEPPDMEEVLHSKTEMMGFEKPAYISDLKKFMPFFKKVGLF